MIEPGRVLRALTLDVVRTEDGYTVSGGAGVTQPTTNARITPTTTARAAMPVKSAVNFIQRLELAISATARSEISFAISAARSAPCWCWTRRL